MCASEDVTVTVMKSLPTKPQGRPVLLGLKLDQAVQSYITALRDVGGLVSTAIALYRRCKSDSDDMSKVSFEENGVCEVELLKCWKVTSAHFEEVRGLSWRISQLKP